MFNNFNAIWIAIIGLFVMVFVFGMLLAGMYDSMRMKVKEIESKGIIHNYKIM